MKPTVKLGKLLMLLWMGFSIAMILSKLVIQIAHHCCSISLPHATVQQGMVRITICSISLLYLHLYEQKGIKNFMKPPANFIKLGMHTILAQLLMTLFLILWTSIQAALWNPNAPPTLPFHSITHFLLLGILQTSCLAPIGEELLFRGILQKLLCAITQRSILATIINALAFSLIHGHTANGLWYFTMGCFLSNLYHKTKHIIYPIIAHAVHNLWAIAIVYFQLNEIVGSAVNPLPIIVRSIIAMGCLLAVYFWVTYPVAAYTKPTQNNL